MYAGVKKGCYYAVTVYLPPPSIFTIIEARKGGCLTVLVWQWVWQIDTDFYIFWRLGRVHPDVHWQYLLIQNNLSLIFRECPWSYCLLKSIYMCSRAMANSIPSQEGSFKPLLAQLGCHGSQDAVFSPWLFFIIPSLKVQKYFVVFLVIAFATYTPSQWQLNDCSRRNVGFDCLHKGSLYTQHNEKSSCAFYTKKRERFQRLFCSDSIHASKAY